MRHLILLLLTAFTLSTSAQTINRQFSDTPLIEALQSIAQEQTEYSVDIMSDNLEGLFTSVQIRKKSVPEAVEQICKGQPVKVKIRGNKISIRHLSESQMRKLGFYDGPREIRLEGNVIDGFLEIPLPDAKISICRADSSVLIDSVAITVFYRGYGSSIKPSYAHYGTNLTTDENTLLVHASLKGYTDAWQKVNIGKSTEIEVPNLKMLKRMEFALDEVKITATRVKMFYRGDTLVYDATAFKLPEGSMLDDLIRQMPGVTLNDAGEIYVNGRKVDELLLGAHSFMRGNKKILMENLPYYTVKELKVYEKQSDKSKALGYDVDPRKYVMDVNLKQEYQKGYIANVEGAVGTEDRWLARGFLLGFTDHTSIAAFGNANNVNESSHIGESGHWTPATMPSSMITTRSLATEIAYHPTGEKFRNTFNADYTSSSVVSDMSQRYEQFLTGGTPVSVSSAHNNSGNKKLNIHDEFQLNKPLWMPTQINYTYATRDGSFNSSFDQWNDTLTASNRSIGMSEGKMWNVMFETQGAFNINKEKKLHADFYLKYDHTNDESQSASRYDTQQFANPSSQTTHNTNDIFNHNTWGTASFNTGLGLGHDVEMGLGESFYFINNHTCDYLYHPDSLLLPSEIDMLTAITDPRNSYDSRSLITQNNVGISVYQRGSYGVGNYKIGYTKWDLGISMPIRHSRLDYERGAIDTLATSNALFLNFRGSFRHMSKDGKYDLRIYANHDRQDLDLIQLIGWRDDSRPLVVRMGNPDLKGDIITKASIDYSIRDINTDLHANLHVGASMNYLHRSVAESVVYDATTGVYTYKPMNVNGAYTLNGTFDLSGNFDEKKYWTFQTNADANLHHSVDHAMLTGMTESEENIVNTLTLHDNTYIQYNKDKLNIRATGDIRWRHSEGRMRDFETLNACDFQYGLSGRYTIPRINLTLSADATMYSRRGYGSSSLNTDDFLVNASASRPFFKGKLIARLEAFDIFHQLSSTRYEVNAQGRTETWYRSLPNYVMFHLVYHWNKNPKKK